MISLAKHTEQNYLATAHLMKSDRIIRCLCVTSPLPNRGLFYYYTHHE